MSKYEDIVSQEDWLLALDGRALVLTDDQPLSHILEPQQSYSGDFLVSGIGFDCDDTLPFDVSRIRSCGIAAVLAPSFPKLFLRNSLAIGVPALLIAEAAAIRPRDRLRIDIEAHVVANRNSGDRYVIRNLSDTEILSLREKANSAATH